MLRLLCRRGFEDGSEFSSNLVVELAGMAPGYDHMEGRNGEDIPLVLAIRAT